MGLERVIGFGFRLAKKEPKILLPNVLSWIPTSLFYLLLVGAISKARTLLLWNDLSQLTNPSVLLPLLGEFMIYIVLSIPLIILGVIIGLFLRCVYSEIARTAYARRRIFLTKIFSFSRLRVLSLFWTLFLFGLTIIGVFLGSIFLLVIGFVIHAVIGVLLLVALVILGIPAFFLFIVTSWFIPTIVVVEKRSGFEALKRSFNIGKKHFWSALGVMIILGISVAVVNAAFGAIPVIGFLATMVAKLFLDAWVSLVPTSFYFEYTRKRGAY